MKKFQLYRKLIGGAWYKIYYPVHYLHGDYTEWERTTRGLLFPFNGKLVSKEYYDK